MESLGLRRNGKRIALELSAGEFMRQGGLFHGAQTSTRGAAESQQERLAELERVRRRIATDLHDDIGSSLTQSSILSEVLQQKTSDLTMDRCTVNATAERPLSQRARSQMSFFCRKTRGMREAL